MPREQDLHVRDRVDRDAGAADLADGARIVGVVAELRRQVERDREPRLTVVEQVAVARVRLLGRREAGVLPDRPRPPAVHVGIRPARVRIGARRLERRRRIVRRVERFHFDTRLGFAPVGGGHGESMLAACASSPACCSRSCARRRAAAASSRGCGGCADGIDVPPRREDARRLARELHGPRVGKAPTAHPGLAGVTDDGADARRRRSASEVHGRLVFSHWENGPVVPSEAVRATASGCSSRSTVRVRLDRNPRRGRLCSSSRRAADRSTTSASTLRLLATSSPGAAVELVYTAGQRPCRHRREAPRRRGAAGLAADVRSGTTRSRSFAHAVVRARTATRSRSSRSPRARTRTSSPPAGGFGASASTGRGNCSTHRLPAGRTSSRRGRRTATRLAFVRERKGYGHLMIMRQGNGALGPVAQLGYALGYYGHHDWGLAWAAVTVRLFAGLRERAGWSRREVDAATVADVWPALGLGDEPAGLLYAVNREYAERDRALATATRSRSSRRCRAARSC